MHKATPLLPRGRECTQRCRSDGHQSGGPPDAAGGVLHRRIAATAGARAGDLTEGPCGRSPPLGRVQARHGGPEPAPVRGRSGSEPLDLTVVTASSGEIFQDLRYATLDPTLDQVQPFQNWPWTTLALHRMGDLGPRWATLDRPWTAWSKVGPSRNGSTGTLFSSTS